MRKILFYFTIIIACFFSIQEVNAFAISPSKILVTVDPGKDQTVAIEIKNQETQDLNFTLKILGIEQDGYGRPIFKNNINIAEKWIKPELDSIFIKSGEKKIANFIIKVPLGAEPGSHYIGLAVQSITAEKKQVGLSGQLVSILTLQVSGVVRESVIISKWDILSQSFKSKNFEFDLELQNKGTVGIDLSGDLKITTWRNKSILEKKVNLGNQLIVHSMRSLQPKITISNENLRLPGLYQAQIRVNYGKTKQSVISTVHFWYLPIWFWTVVSILVVTALLIVYMLFRKLKRC